MGNRLRTLTNIGGGGYPALVAGLTHAYSFDVYNTGTISDKIGTNNFTTSSPVPAMLVSGKVGNCFDYNLGAISNQYSYTSPASNLQILGYGYTMKIWYYADDITTLKSIVDGKYNLTTYYGIDITAQGGGKLNINYGNGSSNASGGRRTYLSADVCINIGWNYICAGFPSYNNFVVNVNGVVQTMVYSSGTATSVNFVDCEYGLLTAFAKAKLDEFYIWNRVLSASEMQEIYTVENAGTSILP